MFPLFLRFARREKKRFLAKIEHELLESIHKERGWHMWLKEGSGTESKGQFVIDPETGLILTCLGWKTHSDQQFSNVEKISETRFAFSVFIPESKSPGLSFYTQSWDILILIMKG